MEGIDHLLQWVAGGFWRIEPAIVDHGEDLDEQRSLGVRVCHAPSAPVHSDERSIPQQNQIGRDRRDLTASEADDEQATAFAQGAECGLGRGISDGIDDHIDSVGSDGSDGVFEVSRVGVEDHSRPCGCSMGGLCGG